jgi:uncharacterized protein YeaO (DUF488 family)
MPRVRARRVYDEPEPSDGRRVLVDRLWPRGLAREAAHIDEWLKAIAPSDELRRWYGHDPAKFDEFRRRYGDELQEPERAGALLHLRELAASGQVTLLTATRDLEHSQAADLAERLRLRQQEAAADAEHERGGDPACWLSQVCPRCGTMTGTKPPTTCPHCHAEIPAT